MSAEQKFYKLLNLREGEEIVKVIRRYPLTLFFKILLVLVLILLPFFLMFLLFSWGIWGAAIFLIVLFAGIFYGLRIFIIWYYNTSIITNYRVIDFDQQGFFEKTVSGITYDKIQDVSYYQKGICQTLFKYGSVQLQIANTSTKIKLRYVYHPAEVNELILQLQNDYKPIEPEEAKITNNGRLEDTWEDIKELSDEELKIIQDKIGNKFKEKEKVVEEIFNEDE